MKSILKPTSSLEKNCFSKNEESDQVRRIKTMPKTEFVDLISTKEVDLEGDSQADGCKRKKEHANVLEEPE